MPNRKSEKKKNVKSEKMQVAKIASWPNCCYRFPTHSHFNHLHLSCKNTIPSLAPPKGQTYIRSTRSFSLTPTNSCSKEQGKKKKNTNPKTPYPYSEHTFLEEFYSSPDRTSQILSTQKKKREDKEGVEEAEKKDNNNSEVIFTNMWWADLKATIGQRLNFEGIVCSAVVLARDRNLAVPHVAVPDIRYIDWGELRKRGFKGVVFDKDNTITAPYSSTLWGPIGPSIEQCKSVFADDIAVFSNSAGKYNNLSPSEIFLVLVVPIYTLLLISYGCCFMN